MLSVDEALQRVLADAPVLRGTEILPTVAALGRVLAHAVRAGIDVPPMDNSQMDGYAVRCGDGLRLRVAQRIAAGHTGQELAPGTAARIFTGAALPPGADAVVIQEETRTHGDEVELLAAPQPGQWIRPAGFDLAAGAEALPTGRRLQPQDLGLAASVGAATLEVLRRPRVAVFFTGDELTMPGEPLAPGRIYNSNRFLLNGLLQGQGCEVQDLGIVPDRLQDTREALVRAAAGADLILTSGGVSVGDEDHVKAAVQAEGTLDLWQIAMKPGKPLAHGRVHGVPFLGLPGNPVSSFVTFLLFARPLLLRLQGVAAVEPRALALRADFDRPRADARREFLRARRNAAGGLDLHANQNAAVLTSVCWADGLIDQPAGQPIVRGETLRFLPFAELLA